MRKLRLLKLKIENFKGVKKLELDFKGKDRVLAGTNKVGKTTVADAFSWLISNKNSEGVTQFEIKPLNKNNNEIHHLNTVVEGTFQIIKDGSFEREFVLKKDYHEKWARKRGTTTEKFTGHTTDYYIDDMPEKKPDFKSFINNIIDYETFKLISDPLYFNEQVEWLEQRKIIYRLVDRPEPGEVSAKAELYYLAEKLENVSASKYRSQIKSKMTKIDKKKLDKIRAKIDEVQKNLQGMNINEEKQSIEQSIEKLNTELDWLQEKRAVLKSESQSGKLSKLVDLKSELQGKKEKKLIKANKRIEQYQNEKTKKKNQQMNYETRIKNLENTIELQIERKTSAEEKRKKLLKEYRRIKAEKFPDDGYSCSKCGQKLTEEQVKDLKNNFNKDKSDDLAKVKNKGKNQARLINEATKKIDEANQSIKKLNDMIDGIDLESLDKGLEKGKEYKEKINNNELEDLKELADKIKELNDTADDSTPVDLSSINSKIADTKDELKEKERKLNVIHSKEKAEKRIDELQEEEQTLVNNYETLEKELNDIEKYIKTEIEMLEDDVNGIFELTHFKLFKTQVNGAITETCEAMKEGVPYSELNTGSKYQVGMDIIRTFSNHYGILAPVFIDNRERIAKLPEIDSQTIQLVMTPDRDSLEMINMANEDEMATFIKEEAGIKRESLF